MVAKRVEQIRIQRAYIQSRYGQLHYRIAVPVEAPTRPTLLCLHQTPKSGWDYEPLMPEMARDRVVVAPDTPGYGSSDAPLAPVLIEDYAAVMAQFMTDLEAQGVVPTRAFHVIGYHTGSVTATHMGLTWPDRVERLVLTSLAAYDEAARGQRLETIDRFPTPRPDGSNIMDLWTLMESLNDPRIDPEWRQRSFAEALRSGSRLPWGFMAVYRYDFLDALARLAQPALVLSAEDDLWEPTRRAAPLLPNGRLVELPGVAHGFYALETARVCALLRAFLDEPISADGGL